MTSELDCKCQLLRCFCHLMYLGRVSKCVMQVGIVSCLNRLREDASQAELEGVVGYLCSRRDVDGVIVQLPLPPHLNEEAVIDAFDPSKDVDGFHPLNVGHALHPLTPR